MEGGIEGEVVVEREEEREEDGEIIISWVLSSLQCGGECLWLLQTPSSAHLLNITS